MRKLTAFPFFLLVTCVWSLSHVTVRDVDPATQRFLLYKNSGFTSCSYSPVHGNESSSSEEHWSQAREQTGFCKAAESYGTTTVVPTYVTPSAFLPTWPSSLLQFLSISLSYYGLLQSFRTKRSDDGSKTFSAGNNVTLIPLRLLDTVRMVVWWILAVKNVRKLSVLPWLSPVLWVVPALHFLTYRAGGAGKVMVFASGFLTLVQYASSLALVATRWTEPFISSINYTPEDITSLGIPDYCIAGGLSPAIYTDPHLNIARGLQTAQMALLSLGFIIRLGFLEKRMPNMAKNYALYLVFAMVMLSSSMFLGINAGVAGTSFQYTSGRCFVTVIDMSPKLGYLDVADGRSQRVVATLLGI